MIQTGDILFVKGSSKMSHWVRKFTFGEYTHVGILYDERVIFETDGEYGKATKFPLSTYNGKDIEIYRFGNPTWHDKKLMQQLCDKYEGVPYSYWDIIVKAVFFWLHPRIRGKVAAALGTKKFMICNELVMRIMHEATAHPIFAHSESSNPSEFRNLIKMNPDLFSRVL
jgi:hypothetical protein